MPLSVEHAALLLLFQNRPQLALELLHAAGLKMDAAEPATLENVDLTSAVPAEYRTDLVVRYQGGKRPVVVVVELQRSRDPEKRYSWPAYVALLRARFRCEVRLLVVAPRAAVARWCAQPIEIGNGATFTPTVLGPAVIPVVVDPQQARAAPELAVLSAIAHGRGDLDQAVAIGLASLSAVGSLEPERGMLYFDLVLSALGEAARKAILAMIPQGYQWQSEWARKHIAEGRALGEAEGRALGEAEGRALGEAEGRALGEAEGRALGEALGEARGKANAVVAVLEARGRELAPAERERILTCQDLPELERWVRRAVTCGSAAELFA